MLNKENARCLGIITARGGSKAIKNKNIRSLAGKPLINYSIEIARASRHITDVVVSTDCENIQQAAIDAGGEAPFLRPREISGDTSKQEDAILHAMDWYESRGSKFDLVCLLQPTLPLRSLETLDAGFCHFFGHAEASGVLSVSVAEHPPQLYNTLSVCGYMKDFMSEHVRWANRQELASYYKISPLVAISRWDSFRKEQTFCQENTLSLIVDHIEATDIDTPLDFLFAEWLLQNGVKSQKDAETLMG